MYYSQKETKIIVNINYSGISCRSVHGDHFFISKHTSGSVSLYFNCFLRKFETVFHGEVAFNLNTFCFMGGALPVCLNITTTMSVILAEETKTYLNLQKNYLCHLKISTNKEENVVNK